MTNLKTWREELRDALHISRGIPQEVDRQLLLRMRDTASRERCHCKKRKCCEKSSEQLHWERINRTPPKVQRQIRLRL
jgi:hypothetical protein